MSFWGELKRRNVFKVGAAYLIAAWLILQVASITFPALSLPGWALPLVTVFLIIGFIVALILAWAFELTPEGVKRSEHVPLEESITHVTGRKLNYIVTALLIVAVAYILFDHFYLDRRARQTEVASNVTGQAPDDVEVKEAPKTIAVLPFVNLSPDPDQEYFVDGLTEELLNSLAKIPDLLVTARTSSFTFKGSDKTVQEIASALGVNNILEGSVRKAGNALRITAQLIRAADGFHLWSETYDRELKDIFAVQEDIATTVADELKLTLGIGSTLKQMGGTDNEKAYEHYLVAKGQQFSDVPTVISRALESIDAAIATDSEFARAWALKATLHILQTVVGPSDLADSEREKALYAAQKAVNLDPDLAAGYVSLGYTKMGKGEWIEAESNFGRALELSDESLSSDEIIYAAVYYIGVGYFQKAIDLLTEGRRNDPLNENLRAFYLYPLALAGDYQRVKNEYEYGVKLFGDQWGVGNEFYIMAMLRPGVQLPVDLSQTEVMATNIRQGKFLGIVLENLESPEMGIMKLRRLYQDETNFSSQDYNMFSFWSSYMGDPDLAMDAMEKGYHADPTGIYVAWTPVKREVRQLPRFKEFIREIGLVDYWNKIGWPDICRPTDDGDFVCD